MKDAVVKLRFGAEARGGVCANGHGGDLEGRPIHRAPELAGRFGLRDLETVDLIADRNRTNVARLNIAPDRLDIFTLRDAHLGDAATVFDTRRARHDRADHGIERVDLVHLQKRRARVQTVEPDMGRVEAQFLVIGLPEQGRPANTRACRPDHFDGAGVGIG